VFGFQVAVVAEIFEKMSQTKLLKTRARIIKAFLSLILSCDQVWQLENEFS